LNGLYISRELNSSELFLESSSLCYSKLYKQLSVGRGDSATKEKNVATPAHKGFKKGGEHHLAKEVTQAKADVLARVKEGVPVQAAMVAAGKKPDTVRQWMNRDPEFARALEEAKEQGSKQSFDRHGS
jgi:hypothetical protein